MRTVIPQQPLLPIAGRLAHGAAIWRGRRHAGVQTAGTDGAEERA
jgi:hypothetical protein